jgi:hypothetical protein
MKRVTASLVEQYEREDWVQDLLTSEAGLLMNHWLRASLPKRMIFAEIYGDILRSRSDRKVLDVGGGISSLTPKFSELCRYTVIDKLAHGGLEAMRAWEKELGRQILIEDDWYNALDSVGNQDIIIANDLFPNADQRLELFLERALPRAAEVRVSLTFYNAPRFYMCKRVDADEFMCLLAWSGRQTVTALERFMDRIVEPDLSVFVGNEGSLYSNGRHIALATLRGDRHG